MNTIGVISLVKHCGSRIVVDHVTMSVAEGYIVGFLGLKGSGKTTTVGIVFDLCSSPPRRGQWLDARLRAAKQKPKINGVVDYMAQTFSFY